MSQPESGESREHLGVRQVHRTQAQSLCWLFWRDAARIEGRIGPTRRSFNVRREQASSPILPENQREAVNWVIAINPDRVGDLVARAAADDDGAAQHGNITTHHIRPRRPRSDWVLRGGAVGATAWRKDLSMQLKVCYIALGLMERDPK